VSARTRLLKMATSHCECILIMAALLANRKDKKKGPEVDEWAFTVKKSDGSAAAGAGVGASRDDEVSGGDTIKGRPAGLVLDSPKKPPAAVLSDSDGDGDGDGDESESNASAADIASPRGHVDDRKAASANVGSGVAGRNQQPPPLPPMPASVSVASSSSTAAAAGNSKSPPPAAPRQDADSPPESDELLELAQSSSANDLRKTKQAQEYLSSKRDQRSRHSLRSSDDDASDATTELRDDYASPPSVPAPAAPANRDKPKPSSSSAAAAARDRDAEWDDAHKTDTVGIVLFCIRAIHVLITFSFWPLYRPRAKRQAAQVAVLIRVRFGRMLSIDSSAVSARPSPLTCCAVWCRCSSSGTTCASCSCRDRCSGWSS